MIIRKANEKDTDAVLKLLSQVLEIHAKIRPDIFISGTTKYTREELIEIFKNENTPVFVADEGGKVLGYAFCVINEPTEKSNATIPVKSLYIDDLCVDEKQRGKHTGEALFEYVKSEAKKLGCGEITLNVWEGNTPAENFYKKMGLQPRKTTMEFKL